MKEAKNRRACPHLKTNDKIALSFILCHPSKMADFSDRKPADGASCPFARRESTAVFAHF